MDANQLKGIHETLKRGRPIKVESSIWLWNVLESLLFLLKISDSESARVGPNAPHIVQLGRIEVPKKENG